MKKRYIFLFLSSVILLTIFISLWNLVSGGYDKQNRLVFDLKDKRKIDIKHLNSLKIKENLILD